jgi:dethiobiotin synthetase
MRAIVVAGTDTEVGKTVVTAALATAARARGERVAVVNPVQTGLRAGEPGDLDEVRRLSAVDVLHEFARFGDPLAPATAARRAGVIPPTVAELAQRIRALIGRDVVLVEGSGGLLVRFDAAGGTVADLAVLLDAPVVVVARAGLGTLNHCALTCEALRARGVGCLGVVIGAWPDRPDLAAQCNVKDLPRYAGVPLLGRMPEQAGGLSSSAFTEVAIAELGRVAELDAERAFG